MIKRIVQLMRLQQWVKNAFVWVPAFFAGIFFQKGVVIDLGLGFLAFGLVASSIYIFNDCRDVVQDRLHPVKKYRPFAAGTLDGKFAWVLCPVLLALGLSMGYGLSRFGFYILVTYFILNLLYTFLIKKIAILDVVLIAFGFILRVLFGGQIVGVAPSKWLILVTFLLALFLGLAKRRDEFIVFTKGAKTRDSITGYNLSFLDISLVFTASVTAVSYLMYVVSDEVTHRFQTDYLYVTAIPVIVALMRYLQLSMVFENTGSLIQVLLHDRFTQFLVVIWIALFFLIIYVDALKKCLFV